MRFIQVGIGSMGKRWLQQPTGNPDAEVVALVDLDPTALASARKEGNYRKENKMLFRERDHETMLIQL